jgi:hypothetical protein
LSPLWIIWAGAHASKEIPPKAPRKDKEASAMARRRLTFEEQLKGIRAAIRSKRTPVQLKDGLRRRAKWLLNEIRTARRLKKSKEAKIPGPGTLEA